jgi:hypothetical protein
MCHLRRAENEYQECAEVIDRSGDLDIIRLDKATHEREISFSNPRI